MATRRAIRLAAGVVACVSLLAAGAGAAEAESTEPERTSYVLRRWATALLNRESASATVLAVGDSITEGSNSPSLSVRWIDRLQAALRDEYPIAGVGSSGGVGYRSSNYNYPGFTEGVRDGPVVSVASRGLGQRSVGIQSGGSVTFSGVEATTIRVWYSAITFGSPLLVSIDGGAPTTVPTHVTGLSDYRDRWVDIATGGPVGSTHTVVVTRGSGGTFAPQFGGLQLFDGDEGRGTQLIDAARSGRMAVDFARGATGADSSYSDVRDWTTGTGASLIIVGLGVNEWQTSRPPSSYRAEMETLITSLREDDPTVPILLIAWYEPHPAYAGSVPWQDYVDVMRELSEELDDAALVDFTAGPAIATADGLHPSTAGHQTIADTLAQVLSSGWTGPEDVAGPLIEISTPAADAVIPQGEVVMVDFSCADEPGGSGLRRCEGTQDQSSLVDTAVVGEGSITVEATDNAGNLTTATTAYTVVDVTSPVVSIGSPVDGGEFYRNQVAPAAFACSDEEGGSGLAGCVGGVAAGLPIDTTEVGLHQFVVTGTDVQGNDTIVSHSYTVRMRPRCRGAEVTVDLGIGEQPTAGPDVIRGTVGPDRVAALAGDDVVCALGGDDVVALGPGGDLADGGAGRDRIEGGAGNDEVHGGGDGDRLFGLDGLDELWGEFGLDVLNGGLHRDALLGGSGNDHHIGGQGVDRCDGGPGEDSAVQCESEIGIDRPAARYGRRGVS